jgi:hypothetical protein
MARILLLVLVLVVLGACGADSEGELSSDEPMADITIVAIVTSPPRTPYGAGTIEVRDGTCGEIMVEGSPPKVVSGLEEARTNVNCLVAAIDSCIPAVLSIREQDTGFVRQLIVESARPCRLRQTLQIDANLPPANVDCHGASYNKDVVSLSQCSHLGDYEIDLRVSVQ